MYYIGRWIGTNVRTRAPAPAIAMLSRHNRTLRDYADRGLPHHGNHVLAYGYSEAFPLLPRRVTRTQLETITESPERCDELHTHMAGLYTSTIPVLWWDDSVLITFITHARGEATNPRTTVYLTLETYDRQEQREHSHRHLVITVLDDETLQHNWLHKMFDAAEDLITRPYIIPTNKTP